MRQDAPRTTLIYSHTKYADKNYKNYKTHAYILYHKSLILLKISIDLTAGLSTIIMHFVELFYW